MDSTLKRRNILIMKMPRLLSRWWCQASCNGSLRAIRCFAEVVAQVSTRSRTIAVKAVDALTAGCSNEHRRVAGTAERDAPGEETRAGTSSGSINCLPNWS